MKSEKHQLASSESPLLPYDTPEKAPATAQRVKHPGLATAVFRRLVPAGSPTRRFLHRISAGRANPHQAEDRPDSEVQSLIRLTSRGHAGVLHTPPQPGALQRVEALRKRVPARLIIAVCLLIAAVITGFFVPRPL